MSEKIVLFGIDCQDDFCEEGALPVPGGKAALTRVSKMITRIGSALDHVMLSVDSHFDYHIAHDSYWRNSSGTHPEPMKTVISYNDVKTGKWVPTVPSKMNWALYYTKKMEEANRPLIIWNKHCIIGSKGQCFTDEIMSSVRSWEQQYTAVADRVTKGSCVDTENFGVLQAECPTDFSLLGYDSVDTHINTVVVDSLKEYDTILIAGLATEFCVKTTVEQVLSNFGADAAKKFVLLEDGMSAIYKNLGEEFLDKMQKLGMTITTTEKFLK